MLAGDPGKGPVRSGDSSPLDEDFAVPCARQVGKADPSTPWAGCCRSRARSRRGRAGAYLFVPPTAPTDSDGAQFRP